MKIGFHEYDTEVLAEKALLKEVDFNLHDEFLAHCIPILATIPLVKNSTGLYSASKTLAALKEVDNELSKLVGFLYHAPRGKLMRGSMTLPGNANLGSLTPLALYAFKEVHGVKYSAWDKTDKHLFAFLGKFLKPIIEYSGELDSVSVEVARRDMLLTKSGKKAGTLSAITAYKANRVQGININAVCCRIKYQTWLANVQFRTEAMILDLNDWDLMPTALDAVSVAEAKPKTKHDIEF
jgi:hypothetical protein